MTSLGVEKKKLVGAQLDAVAELVQLAKEAQSVIDINRGSNSHNSLQKSSSSRSSSSNEKSDKKKEVTIQPVVVADLVQLAKEAPSIIEITRESKSLEKSSSSRSSSSNNKSQVDEKKTVAIQPVAVADLVQLVKEAPSVIKINRESNSHNSVEKNSSSRSSRLKDKSHVDEKKTVAIQPVVDLVKPVESLPENKSCRVGDLAVTGSPIVDPAKPVSSLVELASQVFDNTKLQEKNDLVVEEKHPRNRIIVQLLVVKWLDQFQKKTSLRR